jgi:hypothetical protein
MSWWGRRLEDIAHADDAPDELEMARRALAGEMPQHRAEARFITKRGDVVNVARTATVVRAPTVGPPDGLVIVDPIAGG